MCPHAIIFISCVSDKTHIGHRYYYILIIPLGGIGDEQI